MRFKSNEEAAGWLAGMIDGEGHVRHGLRQDGEVTRSRYKAIQITNTDIGLLEACKEACDLLGISYHKHLKPTRPKKNGDPRKPCFVLWISSRENLMKVQQLVPIQCEYKKEALDIAISSYKRIPGQKYVMDDLAKERMRVAQQKRRAKELLENMGVK